MKRKILIISLAFAAVLSSCKDFLEVKNESKMDDGFVFNTESETEQVILGLYTLVRSNSGIHSNNLFYDSYSVGSDIEHGPEKPAYGASTRYNPNNFYFQTVNIDASGPTTKWNDLYTIINRCNIVMEALEESELYHRGLESGKPTAMTHMYGEAAVIRAIMYENLTKAWGDVIYSTHAIRNKEDYEGIELEDRHVIQEGEIELLQAVEPYMFYLGQSNYTAERLTRDAALAVMAQLAMQRGGYALHPGHKSQTDFEVKVSDGTGNDSWGFYARRKDWADWYVVANTALKQLRDNTGAVLTSTGENPFQQIFQQSMNLQVSDESIFEVAESPTATTERPYAFGRPSSGPTVAYPPKAYGQVRFFPHFYYGMWDEDDIRRDVTCTVTGNTGSGTEEMISFKQLNCLDGGISLNKWDYNRCGNLSLQVATQRRTGINSVYIRLADAILWLAETEAELQNAGRGGYSFANAKLELAKVRSRAFPNNRSVKVDNYLNGLNTYDEVITAIRNERMWELAGEGRRRFDLVRWGIIGERIQFAKDEIERMVNEMSSKGYVDYDNGNQFPAYIYVQQFDRDSMLKLGAPSILTTNTPSGLVAGSNLEALLTPGWRGNTDQWDANLTYKESNTAIQGLFVNIPDGSAEHNRLKGMNYLRMPWGLQVLYDIEMVVDEDTGKLTEEIKSRTDIRANWVGPIGHFAGYIPGRPARYLLAIPSETIKNSGGKITNSYGFPNT